MKRRRAADGGGPYAAAAAADVARAHHQDAAATARLADSLGEVVRRAAGPRAAAACGGAARALAAALLYRGLAALAGAPTLGEEAGGLVAVRGRRGAPAARAARLVAAGLAVAAPSLVPALAAAARAWLERRRAARAARLVGGLVGRAGPRSSAAAAVRALVLALFYLDGTYYELSQRLLSLRYVLTRHVPDSPDRAGYEVLGLLLFVQLAVQAYLHLRSVLGRAPAASRLSPGSPGSPPGRVDGPAATPAPPSLDLAGPGVMPYIRGRQQRRCTLCLDALRDPAATQCGHVFCWHCIADWVREKPECPLCRREAMAQHILPLRIR